MPGKKQQNEMVFTDAMLWYSQMQNFGLGESVVSAPLKSSTEVTSWAITLLAQSALLKVYSQSVLRNVTVAGNGRARGQRGLSASTNFHSQSCGSLAFAQGLESITAENLHVTGKDQRKALIY